MTRKARWNSTPAEQDYVAAAAYLSLLTDGATSLAIVDALRAAPILNHRANDVLRASALTLLPPDDPEVAKDLKKVKNGERLSQVLLVRGQLEGNRPLTVADGYHRVCASYHLDEDASVPCRIVDVPMSAEASPARTRNTSLSRSSADQS